MFPSHDRGVTSRSGAPTGSQTQSVFIKKKGTARYVALSQGGNTTYQQAVFDLDTGEVVTGQQDANGTLLRKLGSGIIKYPNGWYRIYFITEGTAGTQGWGLTIAKDPQTARISNGEYTEYDGTESVYLWGYNCTSRAYLSSFIYNTSGSNVTMSPDIYPASTTKTIGS